MRESDKRSPRPGLRRAGGTTTSEHHIPRSDSRQGGQKPVRATTLPSATRAVTGSGRHRPRHEPPWGPLPCCGRERDRFKRELQRLRAYRFRILVIEADAATLERGEWRSKLQPLHVLGSLAAWTAQYGLPVWLGGDHETAARFVERYLYQAARAVAMEASAVGAECACREPATP
jgi:hypothetical protein